MRIDKGYWGNWITEGWPIEEVKISDRDREILRDVANKFRSCCERPEEQTKIQLWKDHNDLKNTRPLTPVFYLPHRAINAMWDDVKTSRICAECPYPSGPIWL